MEKNERIQKIKFQEKNFTWVDIQHITESEAAYLKKNYHFHDLDLDDCLSKIQRPKIDEYPDYLFIVLHVPKKNRSGQIVNQEIDIFIGPTYVVTIHEGHNHIRKLFSKFKTTKTLKKEYMGKGSGHFLYMILDDLFDNCFPLLDDLTKQVDSLEHDVFAVNKTKDRLKDILLLKKDIINFRRIIIPQRAIIAQLEHKNKKFLPDNLDVYFDNIVDKIEKMWNNLENLQELVASLQETNESIISHNTNNIIKILTVFSVVMLPLTFITGFYGMNVQGLPLVDGQRDVAVISIVLLSVTATMIGFFRYKKWI